MSTIVFTHEDGSVIETVRELHLAHFSVKEFLLSHYPLPSPRSFFGCAALDNWNALFAQCCLVYLHQFNSPLGPEILLDCPVARYTAQSWIFYAQSSPL